MAKSSSYRWLMQQLASARKWLLATLLISLFSGILLILQATLLAHIVSAVYMHHQSLQYVIPSFIVIFLIVILRAGSAWTKEIVSFRTSAAVREGLRRQLLEHITALGPVHSSEWSTGSLVTTAMEHVEALHGFFAQYLPQMAIAALLPLVILAFIFPVNWVAGGVLLITAPLIPLFMAIIGMGAKSASQKQLQSLARMGGYFLDLLQGLTTLKIFNQAKAQLNVIETVSNNHRRKVMSVLRIAFFSSAVLEFFSALAIALLATYLGLSFLGHLDFGYYDKGATLGVALFILLLAPEFYLPLRELGTHYHARAEAMAAAEEIKKILDKPIPSASIATVMMGTTHALQLELQNVHFAYDEGQRVALNGVDLTVAAGEHIVIVGPSGAGKTTLMNLLLGFIEPQQGQLLINGADITRLALVDWRAHIAWVGQTTRLFHGTLRDNILLARPAATEAELEAAVRAAQVWEFVRELPQGLDTEIKEQNLGLSGGQAQRIALARAYLKNAPLLLLDEPTASLDRESEGLVLAALKPLCAGKTVITLTHRIQTMREADRIIFLDAGRVVAQGRYDELVQTEPRFVALIREECSDA